MRYSLLRAFIPALLGKFFSNLIIAYSGRWSLEVISSLFGLDGGGSSLLVGPLIGLILMIIVIIIMFKVDWETYFSKYVTSSTSKSENSKEDTADIDNF